MVTDTEKIPEFRKTMSGKFLIREIKRDCRDSNLIRLFDEYPVLEIRKMILRRWLDSSVQVFSEDADWIERRVYDLKKENCSSHLWKELLNWYIFNTNTRYKVDDTTDLVSRAIEFAIEITKQDVDGVRGSFYRSDILKIIVGRLEETPHIYEKMKTPSLKPFLESFLTQEYEPEGDIIYYELIDVKRVVRCAIAVEDWTFLPLIEKVLAKLYQTAENQQKEKEYDFVDETKILQTQVFLKEAVRFFKEKMEEVKETEEDQ